MHMAMAPSNSLEETKNPVLTSLEAVEAMFGRHLPQTKQGIENPRTSVHIGRHPPKVFRDADENHEIGSGVVFVHGKLGAEPWQNGRSAM